MRFTIGFCIVFSLMFVGCTFTPGGSSTKSSGTQKLQVSGSSTVGPLLSEIAKRYEKKHPDVRIEIQTGGSSRGIADAGGGIVDIGMSSRDLKDSEKAGRTQWPIAMDGVCFIVHAKNPVKTLTLKQLKGIFTGKVTRWNQVGGPDSEITVINRNAGRSELDLVTDFFEIEPEQIQTDLFAGENQQGIKMVANDVNAITYMSVGTSEYESQHGSPIRLLPLDGVEDTVANVGAGKFPLARPLILVTDSRPSALAKNFIRFAQSTSVHDLVEGLSYVPIKE